MPYIGLNYVNARQVSDGLRGYSWRNILERRIGNATGHKAAAGLRQWLEKAGSNPRYKGNARHFQENSDRLPRKRGSDAVKRGLSKDLVCIPCAVDNAGHSTAKIAKTGKCSAQAVSKAFEGKIAPESVLCSDGDTSYQSFAKANSNVLIQIIGGRETINGYNIQRVNSYHSQLETFLRKFNGVSSKYLNNYLIWHNAIKYCKRYAQNKLKLMLATATSAKMKVRVSTLSKRAEIPILV